MIIAACWPHSADSDIDTETHGETYWGLAKWEPLLWLGSGLSRNTVYRWDSAKYAI